LKVLATKLLGFTSFVLPPDFDEIRNALTTDPMPDESM
jgi:hypothetical protein